VGNQKFPPLFLFVVVHKAGDSIIEYQELEAKKPF
jgi:hypothetical protein